jgi:hypothetical protein
MIRLEARAPVAAVMWAVTVSLAVLCLAAFLATVSYEYQVAAIILLLVAAAAVWLIPRAVRKEPSVTVALLTTALIVKLVGGLARYVALQVIFGGGDALSYHRAGEASYQLVRSFDFSFIRPPYFSTDFVEDLVAFVYAATGPSMLGAFLIFSTLSFIGTWLFYRAHRISFPNGRSRLYFLLLFFLPTMAFWPSSLGKDALIVFGLGVATYALANLLQRLAVRHFLMLVLGVAFTFGVRPAVAVMFLFGASAAFLIHPGALRSPMSRPIGMVFLGPVLLVGLLYSINLALEYEKLDSSVQGVVEEYVATHERLLQEGGSVIEGPAPTSPGGFGQAVLTVMFRPFPWELSDPLALIAGLESLILLAIVIVRFPAAGRALKQWRGGMLVAALLVTFAIIVPLTAVANFGLLVRQRAQVLPFLFMVFTAAPPRLRPVPRTAFQPRAVPRQATATSG